MQRGSNDSAVARPIQPDCAFCQQSSIATYILKETSAFRILADHAPLVEGHLLIVPKNHYLCYGDVPSTLDEELFALKHEVRQFFDQFYSPIVFWEHGVFRQTVFHAHLHCFPFGKLTYDISENLHTHAVQSQEDIRTWYTTHGHYFYLEDARNSLLFAPNIEDYARVIQEVLRPGAAAHNGSRQWRSAQQRQAEGKTLIQTTTARWHLFQQQGVHYAD